MYNVSFEDRLKSIIRKNLRQDGLDNSFLAKQLCLSEAQFYRKVKQELNCSPNVLVRNIRLKTARSLLSLSHKSVQEIAFSVGFSHVGYFIRRFEEQFGQSPGQLRKEMST